MKITKINYTVLHLLHKCRSFGEHSELILINLSKSNSDFDSCIATRMFGRCEKLINLENFGVIKPKKQAQIVKGRNTKKVIIVYSKKPDFYIKYPQNLF